MLLRPAVFLALAPILPAVIHDGDDSEGPSLGVSPPDITDGAGVALSVFVYDEPAFDNSDLIECYQQEHKGMSPWQDERTDTAQDMAEVWMHRALLQHPWRVLDPAKADLFYVPIYPVLRYSGIREAAHVYCVFSTDSVQCCLTICTARDAHGALKVRTLFDETIPTRDN